MINDIYQVVLENEENQSLHHVAYFDSKDNAMNCIDKLYSNIVSRGITVKVFKNELNSEKWNGVVDYNELLCKFD